MISRFERKKKFQDEVNNKFLSNLEYLLKLNPDRVNDYFDMCLSISYNVYRHYPNYWACRKGLSMVSKTKAWGYLN